IYVSFVEIFDKARQILETELGARGGTWTTVAAFFFGFLLIAIIDKLVPSFENPHEMRMVEDLDDQRKLRNGHLMRMGLMSALAIGIHNFPEGLATFTAALKDPRLGVSIAIAIAIHNIPEGIAVSIPIYYATGSRRKALLYSGLSGVAEPVGALVGYFFLMAFFSDVLFGVLFSSVAGIMVFLSLDELLPSAQRYGEHHLAIYGLVSGMVVMALSLLLLM
ncbi:MAG TPA: zinc transporter ZupT, partial [Candidatus Hydrogenedentes bacterium]|nr:zinc transporter ZupT [Candidatus Hydrogenedentota bacterium]